jgi:hypothetical protein
MGCKIRKRKVFYGNPDSLSKITRYKYRPRTVAGYKLLNFTV